MIGRGWKQEEERAPATSPPCVPGFTSTLPFFFLLSLFTDFPGARAADARQVSHRADLVVRVVRVRVGSVVRVVRVVVGVTVVRVAVVIVVTTVVAVVVIVVLVVVLRLGRLGLGGLGLRLGLGLVLLLVLLLRRLVLRPAVLGASGGTGLLL